MKKIILIFFILNLFTINAKSEIAYIDINFVLNTSKVGKFLNNYIENIRNENLEKYKIIETELVKKEKLLIAQQNILDKDEFQKKLNVLTIEIKKYRSDKQLSFDKLKKIKIDKTNEILTVLNPIITEYVDLNEISLVIPKKNIVVGKKNLDITDQIILLLNQNIINLKF